MKKPQCSENACKYRVETPWMLQCSNDFTISLHLLVQVIPVRRYASSEHNMRAISLLQGESLEQKEEKRAIIEKPLSYKTM